MKHTVVRAYCPNIYTVRRRYRETPQSRENIFKCYASLSCLWCKFFTRLTDNIKIFSKFENTYGIALVFRRLNIAFQKFTK